MLTLCSFTDTTQTKSGIASFYHNKFEGRKTANGEIFRQHKLTAASNFYKLGSMVEVTNKKTGQSVVVKINDRMHPRMAQMGRIVDLSKAAATLIGFYDGLKKVTVRLL